MRRSVLTSPRRAPVPKDPQDRQGRFHGNSEASNLSRNQIRRPFTSRQRSQTKSREVKRPPRPLNLVNASPDHAPGRGPVEELVQLIMEGDGVRICGLGQPLGPSPDWPSQLRLRKEQPIFMPPLLQGNVLAPRSRQKFAKTATKGGHLGRAPAKLGPPSIRWRFREEALEIERAGVSSLHARKIRAPADSRCPKILNRRSSLNCGRKRSYGSVSHGAAV